MTDYPAPDEPRSAPVWENYVVAQVVQACLGQIPAHAVAVGVAVDKTDVRVLFQLSLSTQDDNDDIEEIAAELEDLLGQEIHVTSACEVVENRRIDPADGVRWVYVARR